MKTKQTPPSTEAGFVIGLMLLTLITMFLASCSSDDDKSPDTSSLFAGEYSVEDVSSSGNVYNYDVSIAKGGNGEIKISNFADIFNVPVKATVNGMNFTIPSQKFTNPSGKQITVSGSGSLQNDVLTFTYTTTGWLDYSGNCQAVRNN